MKVKWVLSRYKKKNCCSTFSKSKKYFFRSSSTTPLCFKIEQNRIKIKSMCFILIFFVFFLLVERWIEIKSRRQYLTFSLKCFTKANVFTSSSLHVDFIIEKLQERQAYKSLAEIKSSQRVVTITSQKCKLASEFKQRFAETLFSRKWISLIRADFTGQ